MSWFLVNYERTWYLAMVIVNDKCMMASKCTSIVAHFEVLADVPVQYNAHRLMHHVPQRPPGHQQTKQQ